ncbi:MAG: DNA N-6-adenine-methyltransferase [Limisphaerales bacterium]
MRIRNHRLKRRSGTETGNEREIETEQRGLAVHFSSQTDEWATPQWLFEALNREFGFTLDPCSTHQNAKCARHFTREEDGLSRSWANEVVWMNPPYGQGIGAWISKAFDAARLDQALVVCLIPSRTDTRWWHRYVMKHEIRLLRGRLRFGEATASAPFPSAIVVMRPRSFQLIGFEA